MISGVWSELFYGLSILVSLLWFVLAGVATSAETDGNLRDYISDSDSAGFAKNPIRGQGQIEWRHALTTL